MTKDTPVKAGDKKPWPHSGSVLDAPTVTYYYGFDISAYPGDTKMSTLWSGSPLWYTGFYLAPAPHRTDASWMSKRTYLKGILSIF